MLTRTSDAQKNTGVKGNVLALLICSTRHAKNPKKGRLTVQSVGQDASKSPCTSNLFKVKFSVPGTQKVSLGYF